LPAPDSTGGVFFFDLYGTLLAPRGAPLAPRPDLTSWMLLAEHNRLGVLANLAPGLHVSELRRTLEGVYLRDFFDPALLVAASDLPTPLPDRRAFAAAAALAGVAVSDCRFVSNNPALRQAAEAAGMPALPLSAGPGAEAGGAAALLAGFPGDAAALRAIGPENAALRAAGPQDAVLLAGEVYEDTGPTYVLAGRVVTLSDDGDKVVDGGRILISKGKIVDILKPEQPLPPAFQQAPSLDTGSTLYPGMMDLHNHFAYNLLPLWPVPKHFDNRSQWPRNADYKPLISLPTTALAAYAETARALVRYVETKALMGGITTGQGIRTKVNGGLKLFRGALRYVEETKDERLPEAATLVPDLYVAKKDNVLAFRRGLEHHEAYFYHLAEGIDAVAQQHYQDLADHDLLQRSLVGIHSLGAGKAGLAALAKAGAKIVWSPFSNMLLYGRTLDLAALLASRVLFSIGCDWSPTGSKNLLEELKIARWEANRQQVDLSAEDLVRAVTANAAKICAWDKWLGVLKPGALCDLVAINGVKGQDVYTNLIDATEADVTLVVVHGIPRYGDADLMNSLHFDKANPLEQVKVAGARRALYLYTPDAGPVGVSFAAAQATLEEAMGDLPAFVKKSQADSASLSSLGIEPAFTVELDMDAGGPADVDAGEAELAADYSKIADSIPLDPPVVGASDYWDRIEKQANLPAELKKELKNAYP
jgi:5-methylthioadenosine/S-adenosylhomocysteine deaminase